MKALIVEDDDVSRMLLEKLLKGYGTCDLAVNGKEAVGAVAVSLKAGNPYDLICLDIMMPEMDGHQALKTIRQMEQIAGIKREGRAKVLMTTAYANETNITRAVQQQCNGFLVKPIQKIRLEEELRRLKVIP